MNMSQRFISIGTSANAIFYAVALAGAAFAGGLFATTDARAEVQSQQPRASVSIRSEIWIERTTTENGKEATELVNPKDVTVIPGDKLIIYNFYENEGSSPRENYVATNPLNPAVAFISVDEDWAEVSVDGGKTWGQLANLVKTVQSVNADGAETTANRGAAPGDVTHIRWRFDEPLRPGQKGKLTFRGVVR